MEALRAANDEEIAQMPSWVYTFWQSMCKEGRKEETAKSYARTFARLFEEDRKAPSEMATQSYFDITKASPKNKSGNGQRSASVAAFQKFYNGIKGDTSKLVEPTEDAKFCQVKTEGELRVRQTGPRTRIPNEAGGAAKEAKAAAKSEASGAAKEAKAAAKNEASGAAKEAKAKDRKDRKDRKDKHKEKRMIKVADDLQRKTVTLTRAFELLQAVPGAARPRAIHVHGRDVNKRMAQRIHGLYTELQDEVRGGKRVFEKADDEKKTYISFNNEKKSWRMSVSMEESGDFAKVKDPVELPWMVTKPWRVFGESNKYEEDPDLKCDYLDPGRPLPDAEVEVCLKMSDSGSPPGQPTGTSSSSKRKEEPKRTGARALPISGLDDSIKNVQKLMAICYEEAGVSDKEDSLESDEPKKAKPPAKKPKLASEDSSSASSSDSDPSEAPAAPQATRGGSGHLQPGIPHHIGRACAKMAVRTGLCCYRCFQPRGSCSCNRKA